MLHARIVLVDHDADHHLRDRLDALAGAASEVVVVDNASTDDSWRDAQRPGVTLIREPENRGFAEGANQGASGASTDWIVFCNPDAALDAALLTALLTEVPQGVGIIAPIQTDARGRPRPESGGYDLTLPRLLAWAMLPQKVRKDRGPWLAAPFPSSDVDVPWVSGAVLAIRRELFERLGGFDERFFLYLEDADLCRRARHLGARVVCRGGVSVRHDPSQGEPQRRAAALRSSTEAHLRWFSGGRRVGAAIILAVGYGLRALSGTPGAAPAARTALRSLAQRSS